MKKGHSLSTETLIGKTIEVVDAKNPACNGIKGIVRKETRNTIVVEHEGVSRTLLKRGISFDVHQDGRKVRIEGSSIAKKIEEKLKIK